MLLVSEIVYFFSMRLVRGDLIDHFLCLFDDCLALLLYLIGINHSLARKECALLMLNECEGIVLALVVTLETLQTLLTPVDNDLILVYE